MKREGWAAAVGEVFKLRGGGTARLIEYRVGWDQPGIISEYLEATLEVGGIQATATYAADGSFEQLASGLVGIHPTPGVPHALDLIEWDRPKR